MTQGRTVARRTWIAMLLLAALIAALLVWAFMPAPLAVEVAAVRRGAFEQTIDEDGRTRVRARYVVAAPLAGRLARITLDAGDPVQAGRPVARIAPVPPALRDARELRELGERVGAAEAAQGQARAEVRRAESAQAQAALDAARVEKLQREGFVAPAAREQAQLALRTATQALEVARGAEHAAGHALAQARAALLAAREVPLDGAAARAFEVTAPVGGRVLRVLQQSETSVAIGTPLLEIADTRELEVVVDVLSTEAVRIAPGARVRLEAGLAQPLAGVVRRVEPGAFTKVSALGVEEQRVNVIVDLVAPPDEAWRLGDAFRVDARIVVLSRADAVLVPGAALFRGADGQWAVYVDDGGRARLRAVTLGPRNASDAVVESGLQPGERVIAYPSDSLADGRRVRVVRGG